MNVNRSRRNLAAIVAVCVIAAVAPFASAQYITPDNPGSGNATFTIHSGTNVKEISPWIYGSNSSAITTRTADRSGGNRLTGYNWETNASNAGSDWYHHSDFGLAPGGSSNAPPGAAVEGMIDSAGAAGRASIVTVPMAGYVAADGNGTVDETEIAPSSRWREVVANKTTIYPGSSLSLAPNETDGYVFTDEFANWVENAKQPGQPVFYSLDNEPALWGEELPPGWQSGDEPRPWENPPYPGVPPSAGGRTHPTIHPYTPTYTEMRDRTIAHAGAIKDVNPNAVVFGGVGYGWLEARSLQDAPGWLSSPSHPGGDSNGELHYYEWLLNEVGSEEAIQGRKLMDVLDLHWYPEATGGGIRITGSETSSAVVAARVQAARSLWDPTYTETSWITSCCSGGPIKLLPHLQRDIDDFSLSQTPELPRTKIAITEYNYGGGNHISGGIAEADFLGIMGREGVFAANWWDVGNGSDFTNGAFKMYLNYDGAGSQYGDTSVQAGTSNNATTAVYASLDSEDPNRMVLMAINRTSIDRSAAISVTHDRVFDHANIYELKTGNIDPQSVTTIELSLVNAFLYTLPLYSVTVIELISDGLPGDYNHDCIVNGADYTVWRDTLGLAGDAAADGNEDNIVDEDDFVLWRNNYGRSDLGGGNGGLAAVPEPASIWLILGAGLTMAAGRRVWRTK